MAENTPLILGLPIPSAGAVPHARKTIAEAAARGVEAILLTHSDASLLDPGVVAGLLSADDVDVLLFIEAHTGRHAPFNLARRVQSLARISGGRAGVYLRDTGADPVTLASRPDAVSASAVLDEYVSVLRRLWSSFPESALVGDRVEGLFADVDQITPARHRGDVYGVEGALNVPIATEQRPIVLADAESLHRSSSVDAVIARADVVAPGTPVYRPLTWRPAISGFSADGAPPAKGGVVLRIDAPPSEIAAHLGAAVDALEARTGRRVGTPWTGSPLRLLRTTPVPAV